MPTPADPIIESILIDEEEFRGLVYGLKNSPYSTFADSM
jgi:hypothetical protein